MGDWPCLCGSGNATTAPPNSRVNENDERVIRPGLITTILPNPEGKVNREVGKLRKLLTLVGVRGIVGT